MHKILSSFFRKGSDMILASEMDPLNRRYPGGQLKGFSNTYFNKRDLVLTKILLSSVMSDTNWDFEQMLAEPNFSLYDERLVEYSWILARLALTRSSSECHLLDVGCVLNNALIAEYLGNLVDMIWFMNPSPEKLAYTNNAVYVLSDVRKHKLPPGLKFDVITCLSTLEHIGMDTKRYGGPGGEINLYPDQPQKNALAASQAMIDLLRPNGKLYISVPYGPFEYLYDFGKSAPIYYVFDKERLDDLINSLPVPRSSILIDVYKVVPDQGWVKTTLDDGTIPLYAERCAAAGAVALIELDKSN